MKKLLFLSFSLLCLTGCGKLTCDKGTLDGKFCLITEEKEAIGTCNEGFVLEDNNCVKQETKEFTVTKGCQEGYTLSGSTCYSDETFNMTSTMGCKTVSYAKQYIKNKGWTTKEGEAITRVWVTKEANKCLYWYDFGSMDKFWEEDLTTVQSCPSGTTKVSNSCKKSAKTVSSNTCEEGYILNEAGSLCEKTTTETPAFSCEEGYTLNSVNKCEKTSKVEAAKK